MESREIDVTSELEVYNDGVESRLVEATGTWKLGLKLELELLCEANVDDVGVESRLVDMDGIGVESREVELLSKGVVGGEGADDIDICPSLRFLVGREAASVASCESDFSFRGVIFFGF